MSASAVISVAILLSLLTLLVHESSSSYWFDRVEAKEALSYNGKELRAVIDSAEKLKNSERDFDDEKSAKKEAFKLQHTWEDTAREFRQELQSQFTSVFIPTSLTGSANDSASEPLDNNIIAELDTIAELCGKDDLFMDLLPNHMAALRKLTNIFREKQKTDDLLNFAIRLQHHLKMNYKLWLKAFVTVSNERRELHGLEKPCLFKLIPGSFVNTNILQPPIEANMTNFTNTTDDTTTNATTLLPTSTIENKTCRRIDGEWAVNNVTGTDEHQLWYFREDFLLNVMHWTWHNLYSFTNEQKIDRRGESFGYFHHHLLARYQAERLSNGLSLAEPIDFKNETIIKEGYNPHLADIDNSTESFGLRVPNCNITGAENVVQYRAVIEQDIDDNAFIKTDGSKVSIMNSTTADVMGDLVEASANTINGERYYSSGIHNHGHVLISTLSENRMGVMGATETALRDPVFYRWHLFIDGFFIRMRAWLPPYTPDKDVLPLSWPDVTLQNFIVQTDCAKGEKPLKTYELQTFFKNVNISFNLTAGLEEVEQPIKYCILTLDHMPFVYKFVINSDETRSKRATIRIFMAPRFDVTGERFTMNEQRNLFFSMDEIVTQLHPGVNRINRRSNESLLTIKSKYDESNASGSAGPSQCGCGWPSHLLLPKGTTQGMIFDLFAMVTADEAVPPKPYDPPQPADPNKTNETLPQVPPPPVCVASHILCGKNGDNYPDSRPMGYPFDRRPFKVRKGGGRPKTVADLDEFVEPNSNMKTVQVKIIHSSFRNSNQALEEDTQNSGDQLFEDRRTDWRR